MNIHVITPFFRTQNIPALIVYLEGENVLWHPITDYPIEFGKSWVIPMVCPEPPADWHVSSYKTNYFISHHGIIDDDYYCFMCDDDLYEAGFFAKIRGCTEPVIVVSMKRGQHPVKSDSAHDTATLVARPKNMVRGWVSSQQYIIKGSVLRTIIIDPSGWADGIVGEFLYDHYPIRYEPEWYALFNKLQPGRWDE